MANFCGKCGSPINQETGLCPKCDASAPMNATPSIPVQTNTEDVKTVIADEAFVEETFEPQPAVAEIPEPAVSPEPAVTYEPQYQAPVVPTPQYQAPQYQAPQYQQPYYQQPQQNYYPAPAEKAPKASKPKKEKKPKKARKQMNKVLSCILIIFMCIITFATTLYASAAFTVRNATTEEKVGDIVENADYGELLEALPVSDAAKASSDAENFAELLCDYINYDLQISDRRITVKDIENFIEESDSVEYFTALIMDYFDDFYNDTNRFEFSERELEKFLKDNEDAVVSAFDANRSELLRTDYIVEEHYYTPDTYKEVEVDVLKDFSEWLVDDEDIELITPSNIKDVEPEAFYAVHYGLSYFVIISAVVLTLGLIVLMVICNWKQTLYALGITYILLGGALTVFTFIVADVLVPMVTDLSIASYVAGSVMSVGLPVFLGILGAGVLLLAGGIVATILKKNKKQAEN